VDVMEESHEKALTGYLSRWLAKHWQLVVCYRKPGGSIVKRHQWL